MAKQMRDVNSGAQKVDMLLVDENGLVVSAQGKFDKDLPSEQSGAIGSMCHSALSL